MKISYSPYTLKPVVSLNANSGVEPRQGVLLKVDWGDGKIGYSDLHPWPELGDKTLDEQLSLLRDGKVTTQIEQSLWMANRDADLRSQNKNIFDHGTKLKNNFLISDFRAIKLGQLDEIKQSGFTCLKIKVGRDLEAETEFISRAAGKDFMLRLDFNGTGTWQIFERFIASLDKLVLSRIEYVEDPFPYDDNSWADARKLVKIAIDNQFSRVRWGNFKRIPFDVLIVKPAKMDVDYAMQLCDKYMLQATVTSYMDHPVGIMHALGVAMELKKAHGKRMLDPGCLTHHLYQMDMFGASIPQQGPYLMRVEGTGVGFNGLLEKQAWYQIKLH